MQRNDALFNWLQIEIVREARPTDRSAAETADFFAALLREDHQVTELDKTLINEQYEIQYMCEGEKQVSRFPRDMARKLLQDILDEPKYNQSFEADEAD